MPFVQRDYGGKVKGLYANAQPGYAEEFLPDDHADVLAYRKEHPAPPLPPPLSAEDAKALQREYEAINDELAKLNKAILVHMKVWAELEVALSALLYATLQIKPATSKIAYVIYYSPDGFDSRHKIVDRVLRQLILENPTITSIEPHWDTIDKELGKARKIRNQIAHGAPLILLIREKRYARLSPPAFDVNRVGNLIPTGAIPGLSVNEILRANENVFKLSECIDAANKAIWDFHQYGPDTLQQTLPPLAACLQTFLDHRPSGQTPEARPGPPESSLV